MNKQRQKDTLIDIMNADAKDGLYDHIGEPNKIVSAVEWLVNEIESKGGAWENISIRRVQISIDVSDYLILKRQAKQMEKEQIINFFLFFRNNGEKYLGMTIEQFVEQYYKETYGI